VIAQLKWPITDDSYTVTQLIQQAVPTIPGILRANGWGTPGRGLEPHGWRVTTTLDDESWLECDLPVTVPTPLGTLRSLVADVTGAPTTCRNGHPLDLLATRRHHCPACAKGPSTVCPNGHEYTPSNTHYTDTVGRYCRECVRLRTRAYRARKRQEATT